MEAYKVTFQVPGQYQDQIAIAFAISAESAINKVCHKFKVSHRAVTACEFICARCVA